MNNIADSCRPVSFLLLLAAATALFLGIGGCSFGHHNYLAAGVAEAPASFYVPRASLSAPPAISPGPALSGKVLTLAQCVNIALKQNPETRAAWQNVRAAAARVGMARAAYLPSVNLTGSASRGAAVNLDSQQDAATADIFAANLGVHYLLFNGGGRFAGLKKAEAELLAADFQHNATLQDVVLRVKDAYYQLQAARELELVAKQTVQQVQKHVEAARGRYANGIVARSDVLKAEAEKAGADLQLIQARSKTRIAHGQLAGAMGLRPSQSFEVAALPPNPQQRELADIERLMNLAADTRPELRAALAKIETARAGVKELQARYWPEVTLNTDYGRWDRTFFPQRDEWSLSLGVNWPLFDGFNREYDIRRAKSALSAIIAEQEKLLRGVELEVWTAYSGLIEAGQAIKAAQALVSSAAASAGATEGEYKNGTASILEVTDAQTAGTTARVRLAQTRLDWYMARAALERGIGQTFTGGKSGLSSGMTTIGPEGEKTIEKAQTE